mmetsp:Transcript_41160/g.128477  ORF Transcript_41160/g.128477 Transcript_41160/m.128477 type:complete len:696 (-) Transcript_41160:79-2166(-)
MSWQPTTSTPRRTSWDLCSQPLAAAKEYGPVALEASKQVLDSAKATSREASLGAHRLALRAAPHLQALADSARSASSNAATGTTSTIGTLLARARESCLAQSPGRRSQPCPRLEVCPKAPKQQQEQQQQEQQLQPGGAAATSGAAAGRGELYERAMCELRPQCIAGDLGVDEAYDVRVQLVIRAGSSEFIWEPGPDVKLQYEDRVYYEQAHVWCEDKRARRYRHGQDPSEMQRRLADFERFLTGGREDLVYEEDFEFVEMTARAESGAAEGVPAFLEHSVTGDAADAGELFDRVGVERGWVRRPKALSLGHLFRTRLAGYRRLRSREIVWGPGPGLYWERGDRPLRLLRMSQEPVRVFFGRHEQPYGFHLQDLRGGSGGTEVIEIVEGSPADLRGVVVGRTVKRLCCRGQSWDVRHWSRAQLEEVFAGMPDGFVVEFGKGDTEERRHAPLGDAEMAILMDERFMRGFLHELWHGRGAAAERHFDREGWASIFPGLEAAAEPPAVPQPPALAPERPPAGPPPPRQLPGAAERGHRSSSEDATESAGSAASGPWSAPQRPGSSGSSTPELVPPPYASPVVPDSGAERRSRGRDASMAASGIPREPEGGQEVSMHGWRVRRPDSPLKVRISAQAPLWPAADLFTARAATVSAVAPGDARKALAWGTPLDLPAWRSSPQPPLPAFARAPPGLPPPPGVL